ncbi:MAG: hypothetical protein P1S60_05165, partial [Anaerolineae bacterium]|nr:hypothetical protein [Anaerolineae bacterium]
MEHRDGPASSHFTPLPLKGNTNFTSLEHAPLSDNMRKSLDHAPQASLTAWGVPFAIGEPILLDDQPVEVDISPVQAKWLVFAHTSDERPNPVNEHGFISPMRGAGQLGEHAADYIIRYTDGTEVNVPIRRRYEVGAYQRGWGENCFLAVAAHKPKPIKAHHEQMNPDWGRSQTRASSSDWAPWTNWLWAWENPYPDKLICAVRFVPVTGRIVVSALSAGVVDAHPFRWKSRQKALLHMPSEITFNPEIDEDGLLSQLQLDMGQVISALPRTCYPNAAWAASCNNQLPSASERDIIVEYTAHPSAQFHLSFGEEQKAFIPVADVEKML